ncbi:KDM2A [Cordylochernes scorpioides]|uniref:[histone H3]-dimethyl-L-lysine(36) demethylase n=1 Tax=Cordylochernes scorpioides TaxID=51811 RepID=A0ABY6KFC5_9ARAC|nr:KDM2A [Cordylochernes scorpioides]
MKEKGGSIYHDDEADFEVAPETAYDVLEKVNDSGKYTGDFVQELAGSDVSLDRLMEEGFTRPMLVKQKNGLELRVPSENFTVTDVMSCVGKRRQLQVFRVATQEACEMTMKQWTDYFNNPDRQDLYNCISLEFSDTRLDHYVESPAVIRRLDWVDIMWPAELKSQGDYPRVQKYCLMSTKGSYTDFHIDFAGTSVWYHIIKGEKYFWLIPPTPENLNLYKKWIQSDNQHETFFADLVSECQTVHLETGNTFFIPSGWIHGVYTPQDSLVFGGNFLHSLAMDMHIKVCKIESSARIPKNNRYPFFVDMLWYVLRSYVNMVTGKNYLESDDASQPEAGNFALSKREATGICSIISFLENLPSTKKKAPKLIKDLDGLLNDAKEMVKKEWLEGQIISATMALSKKKKVEKPKKVKRSVPKISDCQNKAPKHRRMKCKKCEPCNRSECGECNFCKDMKKFGGPGRMKQSCVMRACLAMRLSSRAECGLCAGPDASAGEEDYQKSLMECAECNEIVHPRCAKGEGKIKDDLPNLWTCPKCVAKNADTNGDPEAKRPKLEAEVAPPQPLGMIN